eukprot:GGOE01014284.1.p1 GENE.GGOE01014284.1~~GGOE01014284.1.p1  ORF type:complete len:828 (-),score=201.24 GGOE01014284.1:107-2296(-)
MTDAAHNSDSPTDDGSQSVPSHWRFTISHKRLAHNYLRRNRILRRLHMIMKWLEDSLYDDVRYVSAPVRWPKTTQRAKEAKASGTYNADAESAVDPDARHRGASVDADDIASEDRLLVAVFHLVRCGRVAEAQDLCRQSAQPWRASILQATLLKLYGALEGSEVQGEEDTTPQPQGSPFLAKEVYRRLAGNTHLHDYERALCGVLSGHLEAMLLVCGTWKECLWAYLKAVLTYKVDAHLAKYLGEQRYTPQWPLAGRTAGMNDDAAVLEDILAELDHHLKARGLRDAHPYFTPIQKQLLRIFTAHYDLHCPPALNILLQALPDPAGDPWPSRFASHLALTLGVVFQGTAEASENLTNASARLLLEYVGHQQRGEHFTRVAFYTALLPPALRAQTMAELRVVGFPEYMDQVQRLDLRPGDGGTTRREQLMEAANEASLDLVELLKIAVQNSRAQREKWQNDPTAVGLSMVTQPLGRILQQDRAHIECLQWFTLREGYRLEALVQFTESIRAFVREEKLQAAAAVVDLMPGDTASVCEALLKGPITDAQVYRNALREYLCWDHFLGAVRAVQMWRNHWGQQPPPLPAATGVDRNSTIASEVKAQFSLAEDRQRQTHWQEKERALRERALERAWTILTFPGGWLQDEEQSREGLRVEELHRLRSQCLPHAVALVVEIVKATGDHEVCLDVLAILADEPEGDRVPLYRHFEQQALQQVVYDFAALMVEHEQSA